MEHPPIARRYQWLATLVAGLLLGVLSGSTLIVAAYILIIFIAPVLLIPFAVWWIWAAWLGRKGYLPALSPLWAFLLLVLLAPICAYAPPALSGLELRARAGSIPIPPGFEILRVAPDPYGNSNTGPGIVIRLAHAGGEETLLQDIAAYVRTLEADGWRHVIGTVPQARGFNVWLMFTDNHHSNLFFQARWNRTAHVYDDIAVRRSAVAATPMILMGLLLVLLVLPVLLPDRPTHDRQGGRQP